MRRTAALVMAVLLVLCAASAMAATEKRVIPTRWNSQDVEIKILGAYVTVIEVGGEEKTVPTSELLWQNTTDENHRLAYIYAPSIGSMNVRLSPKRGAAIVAKGETGRIVQVFEHGKEWSGIIYDGTVGYALNGTLKFISEPFAPKETCTLSYKGRTTGTTKVTMRVTGSTKAKRVVGLRPGMPTVIFQRGGTWSEVEVNGWHGFVLTEHLAEIVEAPEATPAPNVIDVVEEEVLEDDDIPWEEFINGD